MARPILYTYFRSSASWRVRVALAYKGLEYESRPISLIKDGGQQKSAEYTALNPLQQVPCLIIDGATLTQSLPIIEYLEETRPNPPLLPKDPVLRAKARQIAEIINAFTQPLSNLAVQAVVGEWCGNDKKGEWARIWIDRGFTGLEKVLEKTAGKYCIGDEITIADVALGPQIFNANRFKVDMTKFPIISRIVEELYKHEAFKAADPSRQPDCPEELRA
ncbi:maleylacetoacetate isomerase isoform X2 [Lingula anatina]|uniref:Maleylacetoacetate isomerase isoform X2 n=1 Tax=Lingula anatina TaxID=7574 RepID=A0A1S3JDS0_LINAN|nr:maleylacetoacetate isomerase isoform X2 [Lingula anatina]|eukprot:XP_013408478.1 maleylacetoacetate isomerase isoform X2 [Lingula anatina]